MADTKISALTALTALFAWMICWPAYGALEEWPCWWLADFYGYVAVDRDNGVTFKDRSNKTVRDIITVMDSSIAAMDVEAADAQALLRIVQYVYLHRGTPYQIRREALMRCRVGQMEPPAAKPAGNGTT